MREDGEILTITEKDYMVTLAHSLSTWRTRRGKSKESIKAATKTLLNP